MNKSMNKFEIGEVVIIQAVLNAHKYLNGEEAIITSLPGRITEFPESYGISCRDKDITSSHPRCLRKKEPPEPSRGDMDTIVSWDDCAWKPPHLITEEA